MDLHDWLLALHLLAAFTAAAAVVVFGGIILAERAAGPGTAGGTTAAPVRRLSRLAEMLWNVGGGTVLLFGVWLAIEMDEYELWDLWVIAALVLWLIAGRAGMQVAQGFGGGPRRAAAAGDAPTPREARSVTVPYTIMAVALIALLLDMIFKPGA